LFAVQSEIAQKVAQHLHAKLSASEKASIEEKPTQTWSHMIFMFALSLYYHRPGASQAGLVNFSDAVDLLNKAVARDPNFLLAYCQLAFVHDLIYNGDTWIHHRETDHTAARLGLGKVGHRFCVSVEAGFGRSALGAWAGISIGVIPIMTAPRAELALAQQSLPNDARAFALAWTDRPETESLG
jgi:hypothetical protein